MKKLYLFFVFLAVFALLWAGLSLYTDFAGKDGGESVSLSIKKGAAGAEISELLKANTVIAHPRAFAFWAKLTGANLKFKYGVHSLRENMGYGEVSKSLQKGAGGGVRIVIPEGFELSQIAKRVADSGLADEASFLRAANEGEFDFDFLKSIPPREGRLEGYLFPASYDFEPEAGAEQIIGAMLKRFSAMMTPEYINRAGEMGMSVDDIVTLASIIERETGNQTERAMVASVFYNRLKSKTYPYLESCATVQYILRERKPRLSVADTNIDSPYNTYKNKGLPPGPIASPGEESIKAALWPEQSDYLFFVMGKDNKHIFSKTYEEHLRAKNN